MPQEIERKFLARLDGEPGGERVEMVQAYPRLGDPEVRVRRAGDRTTITVKQGSGLVREEAEAELDPGVASVLLDTLEARVEKVRHRVGRWEIDVYGGRFHGLVVAEVELESEEEELPEPPEGVRLARELTEDPRFSNARLAGLDEAGARELVEELGASSSRSASFS